MVDREPALHLLGEDDRMKRALLVAGAVAALLTGTACSHHASTPTTTPDPSSTALPAPPHAGSCYRLTVASALESTSAASPVRCSLKHTARTVVVGRIAGTRPMSSAAVQQRIAARCRSAVDAYVGGTREDQRLSRVQAVWFNPPDDLTARGARWFRCDVVIAATPQAFSPLPRHVRGLLDRAGAIDRYGTCGTAAPGTAAFRRVLCSAKHTWRARSTITLPPHTRYLAKAAGKHADSVCRDVEARTAADSLRLRWSFEWPTAAQWRGGQRYGTCWTPE